MTNRIKAAHSSRVEKPNGATQARSLPSTKFGRPCIRKDGTVDLSTVRWSSVVFHEPEMVVGWVSFLHQRNCVKIRPLLHAVVSVLSTFKSEFSPSRTRMTPLRIKLFKTQLPCVLMDILLEPDMFSSEETFKVCIVSRT